MPGNLTKHCILPMDVTFHRFGSVRDSFSWLTHRRLDLFCASERVAKATEEKLSKRHIEEFNREVKKKSILSKSA